MGNIVLKVGDSEKKRYTIPESGPLVFELFNEPTRINRVINKTYAKYYVRLFTNDFYININPNRNYNLKLSEDYKDDKDSIKVISNIFTRGIVRKPVNGLRYNEMIFFSESYYTRINYADSRSVTRVEGLIDSYEEQMKECPDLKVVLKDYLRTEQECTNEMKEMKEQLSKYKQDNIKLRPNPDVKSSNIWLTILYLTIILIITKLIFGIIPYIVALLVITTFMLEMLYGNGFSAIFMYIFYFLLPMMLIIIIIKSVFGISSPPDTYNRYNVIKHEKP